MLELTYDLAMAAGRDAANRSMRAAGRSCWNEDDYNVAARELQRLWPHLWLERNDDESILNDLDTLLEEVAERR